MALRVLALTIIVAFATLMTKVISTPCAPGEPPSPSLTEGITEMEYNVSKASEGKFPFTEDHSSCSSALEPMCSTTGYGMVPQLCPKLCKQLPADPMRGVAVATPSSGNGPYPLFVWFPGTQECNRGSGPLQLLSAMAERGYVSASIEYPQSHAYCNYAFDEKAKALTNGAESPFGMLCALSQVDCSLGIATAGYSQGGHLAVLTAKYEPRIKAAFALASTLVGDHLCAKASWAGSASLAAATNSDLSDMSHLPKNKRRSIIVDLDTDNADNDGTVSAAAALRRQKTFTGADCGNDFACLQSDGSGYFIMNHTELPPLPAWFADYDLGWHECFLDYNNKAQWQSWLLQGAQPWTMNNNLDWLAKAAAVTATDAPTSTSAGTTTTAEPTTTGSGDQTTAVADNGTRNIISASLLLALSLLVCSNST